MARWLSRLPFTPSREACNKFMSSELVISVILETAPFPHVFCSKGLGFALRDVYHSIYILNPCKRDKEKETSKSNVNLLVGAASA